MDQSLFHLRRDVELWLISETESIMPLGLDPPKNRWNNPAHTLYMKPIAFAMELFAFAQIVRESRSLPLEQGLG